jgi:beta-glucosidase
MTLRLIRQIAFIVGGTYLGVGCRPSISLGVGGTGGHAAAVGVGSGGMTTGPCTGNSCPGSTGSTGSGAATTTTTSGGSACGDSTEQLPFTPGQGLDISSAKGYTADPSIKTRAQQIVASMTTSQLANQMRGTPPQSGGVIQFNDLYRTIDDTTAMVKGFALRDGPRGLNLQQAQYTGSGTNPTPISYGNGYSTVFPVSMARGASWDLDLENKIGQDVADEMLASGNTIILAPCVNILRHPAWGRSQETYGEDSFLLGRMGSAYVTGVQQYIPACVRHFAANNIEDGRANQNAQMDDQTLHEIYGRHFEMIVQDGGVACVMASYNLINGTKDTLSGPLLMGMLRGTFGFNGFVLSDFWAMPPYQAIQTSPQQATIAQEGINATLDMELPWALNYSQLESVATMQQLRAAATRIIEQKLRFDVAQAGVASQTLGLKPTTSTLGPNGIDNAAHIADAEQAATEAMVLLKNDNDTLPIKRSAVKTIAVIGAAVPWALPNLGQRGTDDFATDIRTGDLGSSRVLSDPALTIGPAQGIQQAAGSGITVVSGSSATLAQGADFVVLMAGLTEQDEGEEFTGAGDRTDVTGTPSFNLDPKANPGLQNELITTVAAMNKPMVVVLESGSAVNMPWLSMVPAVVQAWYPGMHGGAALAKLLFGDANFSGKLPITWPQSEADEPPFNQGGVTGGTTMMDYYLGYRYFDKNNKKPLFAFGSGLSYTTFHYDLLDVPCVTVTKHAVVDVRVQVTNTGSVPGDEVSFLFVSYPSTTARRSVKELKGFHRTTSPLLPGQSVQFTIPLRIQDLKYWNTSASPAGWTVESGPVQIMVGPSSENLPLTGMLTVQ